jgi:Tol biopolymer transport system component
VARFSPDSKWILFDRRGDGRADLFLLPVIGSGKDTPEQLTFDPATDTDPAWRPMPRP